VEGPAISAQRLPLLTEDERLQVEFTARIPGPERVRIGLELCALGRRILLDGLRDQFGSDEPRIGREFRRRMLGPELAEQVEQHLARGPGHA
jgi:hypothetical protein